MATADREVTIHLRARTAQRELIDRAADAQEVGRAEFILDSACEKAGQVLLDKIFFALDRRAYRRFLGILDASGRRNDCAARLLSSKAPWEK